jgi:UDP-glucose 4-epimerase
MFKNKSILIFGGTGSFGYALLNRLINSKESPKEIKVFSRDEKKQDDMRKYYNSKKIKFIIGDVRDYDATFYATSNVDFIFHAAALKQVPSCEFFPLEAVKTNILGTENILKSSMINKVNKVICLSTDKAVYPINAMGISKAMMEKLAISKSLLKQNKTQICVTRYGNVMGSRGSVIPLLLNQIKEHKPLTITNKDMTRFMMTMDDALDLVVYAFKKGMSGQLFVKKTPSAKVETLVKAILKIKKIEPDYPVRYIGLRHGEKMHETLLSSEEYEKSIETKEYFLISSDTRDLNYNKYFILGKKIKKEQDYNSANTNNLNVDQMIKLLVKSRII